MELYEAIRQLTDQYGYDIVKDYDIIPKLSRKRCFTYRPELKDLYHSLINVGYAQKIIDLIGEEDWHAELNDLAYTFFYRLDYDEDDVDFVFYSVAYGINLFDDVDEHFYFSDENDVEEDEYEDEEDGDEEFENEEYEDEEFEDEDVENDLYSITKQYHEKKNIEIYVVRPQNRLTEEDFDNCRKIARQYGKGYYSSFRGVNGFVFYSMSDAQNFVEHIFDNEIEEINDVRDTISQSRATQIEVSDYQRIPNKTNKQKYDLDNMDLHVALRNIIDTDGIDIVNDVRLVNILSDFKAFDAIPASKYILRAVIADGYARRLISCGKWDLNAKALCSHFASSTGFQEDYVSLIFQSIAYGLRFVNNIDSPQHTPIQPRDNSNAVHVSGVNLNLSQSELNRKSEKFIQNYKENVENYLDSIIEIKGDVKKEIGADISLSSEYDTGDNSFCINIEIKGPIRYKFNNKYSTCLYFNIVLYNTNNKLICKACASIDKDTFKKTYQVLTSDWLLSKQFKHIADIKKLIVYWEG